MLSITEACVEQVFVRETAFVFETHSRCTTKKSNVGKYIPKVLTLKLFGILKMLWLIYRQ